MDTKRGYLEVLFRKIPYHMIQLCEGKAKNDCTSINRELFISYAGEVFPQCTIDERVQIYNQLNEELEKNNNVFGILAESADMMLVYDEKEPKCKYCHVLRWRDISFQLGQDIFTTAFLAYKDVQVNQKTNFFAWSPLIKSDNKRLQNILKKGIAENHFHLNGSTQIFTLSWICLMNHITNREKEFNSLNSLLDSKTIFNITYDNSSSFGERQESLYESCMKAALYRLYLYFVCQEDSSNIEHIKDYFMNENDRMEYEELNDGQEEYNQEESKKIKKRRKFLNLLENFDESDLNSLQQKINAIRYEDGIYFRQTILDYALNKQIIDGNDNEQKLLVGERNLMYQCFQKVFLDKFSNLEKNIFYRYLLIKTMFRSELIQVNRKTGFANFNIYQDRKEIFIEDYPEYKKQLTRLAINSTLECQEFKSLEARIAPKNTHYEIMKKITETDSTVSQDIKKKKRLKKKYFYVIHFIKRADDNPLSEYIPRNTNVRRNVRMQTKAIIALLENNSKIRERIKGIDAANSEIGCRPEVFACSFRYLLNLNVNKMHEYKEVVHPIQLQGTYHVGEDFLDLADGLRAIDEVMVFMNFKRGNRLGHALALGTCPKDYYGFKNYIIRLPKQDLLDNIVWLLEKSKEYGVTIENGLRVMLERKYEDLFSYIYDSSNWKYEEPYSHKNMESQRVTTYEYYCGWKLRGDEPTIYQKNEKEFIQKMDKNTILQSDYYNINREISDELRKNKTYKQLMYSYHFNGSVKKRGSEVCELYINEAYIAVIEMMQDKMISDLCEKGIAIECNPSSNILIGTFGKYEKHPIIRFNSIGLEEQKRSLSVSINTDDQGVFDTLLENEFALLALALEKKKDENGNLKYNPENVYRYLDYIRELGLEQKF